MQRKLNEMDTVVHEVISSVDKDTVVFVLGDHGMTKTGDHGGDTELETTAALFIHSPKGLSTVSSESVKQIDLAPTLATLLDFPIPFSNLGVVIPDLFENSTLIKARSLNSRQIIRYVDGYKNDDPLVQVNKLNDYVIVLERCKENNHLLRTSQCHQPKPRRLWTHVKTPRFGQEFDCQIRRWSC